MRYLGIDYGTTRTGIALSDPGGSFAFPHDVLVTDAQLPQRVAKLATELKAEAIVLGDSRTLSGSANTITTKVDMFAEALSQLTQLPILWVREGWSSQEARRFAPKGKDHDDSAAAAIILQRHLDGLAQKE